MRLWSVHPVYLDCKGLLALWREGLLARKVLSGRTKGYRNHPQLKRFKEQKDTVVFIDTYLFHVWKESKTRCYDFDRGKIGRKITRGKIGVTGREIADEFELLKAKVKKRDPSIYKELIKIKRPEAHPLFSVKEGVGE
ncbi:MAG: hypothetical protein JSV39_02215 [Candidatus Aenigmatarchaeota archaeon]|nr:MAG: hypothetical protein JSV39_02215 [Candidatus Aenigmarchaeota archaeon]